MTPAIKSKLDEMIQKGRSMLEKLKENYPEREYMLPFESTIKKLLQQDKNGKHRHGWKT